MAPNRRVYKSNLLRTWNAQGGLCFYCNKYMVLEENRPSGYIAPTAATLDHLTPKSRGYSTANNVVCAHKSCNDRKKDRLPTIEEINKYKIIYGKMPEVSPDMYQAKPTTQKQNKPKGKRKMFANSKNRAKNFDWRYYNG